MDAFRETVDLCDVRDLGFRGCSFTWRRGNEEGSMVRERLDRFLASEEWCSLFSHHWVQNYPIYRSDHAPILLSADVTARRPVRKKLFHFEALWLLNNECQEVVKGAWESSVRAGIDERVEVCAGKLSMWAAATFGDIKKKIGKKEEELVMWQKRAPDSVMIERCKELVAELDELHRLDETY